MTYTAISDWHGCAQCRVTTEHATHEDGEIRCLDCGAALPPDHHAYAERDA